MPLPLTYIHCSVRVVCRHECGKRRQKWAWFDERNEQSSEYNACVANTQVKMKWKWYWCKGDLIVDGDDENDDDDGEQPKESHTNVQLNIRNWMRKGKKKEKTIHPEWCKCTTTH